MPASATKPQYVGTVVAVGDKVKEVNVGERVCYNQYSGSEVTDTDGLTYIVVNESDIVAILDPVV